MPGNRFPRLRELLKFPQGHRLHFVRFPHTLYIGGSKKISQAAVAVRYYRSEEQYGEAIHRPEVAAPRCVTSAIRRLCSRIGHGRSRPLRLVWLVVPVACPVVSEWPAHLARVKRTRLLLARFKPTPALGIESWWYERIGQWRPTIMAHFIPKWSDDNVRSSSACPLQVFPVGYPSTAFCTSHTGPDDPQFASPIHAHNAGTGKSCFVEFSRLASRLPYFYLDSNMLS
jgi:hypothetical protein